MNKGHASPHGVSTVLQQKLVEQGRQNGKLILFLSTRLSKSREMDTLRVKRYTERYYPATGNVKGNILGGESMWSAVSVFRCAQQIPLEGKEELLVTKSLSPKAVMMS